MYAYGGAMPIPSAVVLFIYSYFLVVVVGQF
jgi:hypothetical protein